MNETRQNLLVGLFALGGLIILGVLVLLFGRIGYFATMDDVYTVNILFERAPGIREGTIVTASGIPVGRVRSVNFTDPGELSAGVQVEAQLQPQYKLREGTTARASEPGLGMGRPPISLRPGPPTAPMLPSGSTIQGDIGSVVESLIPEPVMVDLRKAAAQLGGAADALQPVLQDLHLLLQPRRAADVDRNQDLPGNIASAIERLDQGLHNINVVLGDPDVQRKLTDSIENIYVITEDGKTLFAEMKQTAERLDAATADAQKLIQQTNKSVENIDRSVDQVARELLSAINATSQVMKEVQQLTAGINRGQGTLGLLTNDPRLYEAMVLSFRELEATIEELKILVKQWQEGRVRIGL